MNKALIDLDQSGLFFILLSIDFGSFCSFEAFCRLQTLHYQ